MKFCNKCELQDSNLLKLDKNIECPNGLYSDMEVCGKCLQSLKREVIELLHIFFRTPRRSYLRRVEFMTCPQCNGERGRVLLDSYEFKCFDCGITGKFNNPLPD